MDLTPCDWRVEHAASPHLRPWPQLVALMPVALVQAAQPEPVGPAGLLVQELALALEDEDSFDVVGIPKVVEGHGVEDRLVEREADLFLSSDWPAISSCPGFHLASTGMLPNSPQRPFARASVSAN